MISAWPYPGAKWYKFDCHTHTPKSTDSTWARNSHNLPPQEWLLAYMAAKIDCVAITDHNGAGWIDILQSTYQEMRENPPEGFRDITVFPGVELTTEDEFHLLILFEPGTKRQKIEQFITSAGYRGEFGDANGIGSISLRQILTDVVSLPEFTCIPIAAHVDKNKGILKTKENSQAPIAGDRYLRKIYETGMLNAIEVVDTTVNKPASYIQSKLNLSEVVGSDSHGFRGKDKPGSRYTWVKMETPTLASLKLALIDGQEFSIKRFDDRVPFEPYETPDNFIESIQVKDALYMGKGNNPSLLPFSPYANAIVGGRGTGKSTITHCLRAVLGKEPELDVGSTPYQTYSRFMQEPKFKDDFGALKAETEIELIYSRLGKRHRLIWSQANNEPEVYEEEGGDWKKSEDQEITKDRFPIDLYSQGQIATLVGENKQPLLELIDRSANIDNDELQAAQLKFCAKRAEARSLKQVADQILALRRQLQDIRAKIQKISQSNHQAILTDYNKLQKQKQLFETKKSETWDLINKLNGFFLHEELVSTIPVQSDFDVDIQAFNNSIDAAVEETKNSIKASIEGLQSRVNQIESALLSNSAWKTKYDHAVKKYTELQSRLQSEGINNLNEYSQLVQSEKEIEDRLAKGIVADQQLKEKIIQANEDLKEIKRQRALLTERRKQFLQEVLSNNPYVRINVKPFGCNASVMENAFRDMLSAKTEFQSDIYVQNENGTQGVVSSLLNAATLQNQEERERAIFEIQKLLYKTSTGEDKQAFSARFRSKLINMNGQYQDFADSLLYWFPEDGLDVEYSRTGDGENFTPITQGSAGQRAAAMLAFLLAHSEKPLFIDQPEDDLDNSLIYDLIVSQIKATKSKRQIIMVTHNPNIVVNGDAEMVHALDFNHQCFVKNKGSIQDTQMRSAICKIMEGGTTAFNNRYKRLI